MTLALVVPDLTAMESPEPSGNGSTPDAFDGMLWLVATGLVVCGLVWCGLAVYLWLL